MRPRGISLCLVALVCACALADEASQDSDKTSPDVEHSRYISNSPEVGRPYVFDGKARPIRLDSKIDPYDDPYSGMVKKKHKKSSNKPGKRRPGAKPKPEEAKQEEQAKEPPPDKKGGPAAGSDAQPAERNSSPEPEAAKDGGSEGDSAQGADAGAEEPRPGPDSTGPANSNPPARNPSGGNLGDAMPGGEGSTAPPNSP